MLDLRPQSLTNRSKAIAWVTSPRGTKASKITLIRLNQIAKL